MSWTDDLRPASFRGVPFLVESHELPTGRRVAVETYAGADRAGYQDLGAHRSGGAPIRIDGYLVGDTYMAARNALLDALERGTPGELVHPYYGRLWVMAGEGYATETATEGAFCRVAMEFFERAEIERTTDAVITPAAASASALAGYEAADADFAAAYVAALTESPLVVQRAGLTIVSDVQGIDVLIGTNLMGEVANLTTEEFIDVLGATLTAAITTYDAAAAIADGRVLVSVGWPDVVQAMLVAYDRLVRAVGVRRMVEIAVVETYASADDAEAAQAEVVAAIAGLEGTEGASPSLLMAMRETRARVVQVLTERTEILPRLVSIEVATPTPAFVLAMELYGDPDRAEEIIARNAIPDPGRCAGPLTVLAS